MSQITEFKVSGGVLSSDCLPPTKQFIEQNLAYLTPQVQQIQDALGETGAITFAACEEIWTLSCHVARTELGQIVTAKGTLTNGDTHGRIEETLRATQTEI